jgi:uncharacterized damage-inducible protein DinB
MTNREFFLKTFKADRPAFVKVIRALPDDRLDYKPHEKNMAAGDIAWFLPLELRAMIEAHDKGDTHWQQEPRPKTAGEIADAYEKEADALEERVANASEADWEKDCGMWFQGKKVMSMKWGAMCWSFFLDAVHHRGQLTAYLRPMGGKVPSVYGPSGDESGSL